MWRPEHLEKAKHCGLCGSEEYRLLIHRPDGLPMCECTSCGYVFLSVRPTRAALSEYYDRDYFQKSTTYQDYFNYAQAVVDLGYSPRIHRLQPFIPDWRGQRVLEVGCAAGGILALLRRKGALVSGIELSAEACSVAHDYFGLTCIFNGPLEEAKLPKGSYDIILMFDVLEHLPEPGPVMERLIDSLDQSGRLAFTVPNFDRFDHEGLSWAGLTGYHEHLGYFRQNVIRSWLKSFGFMTLEHHTFSVMANQNRPGLGDTIRRYKRSLVGAFPLFNMPWRFARKLKFRWTGPPNLDTRNDGSGMDQFILSLKKQVVP